MARTNLESAIRQGCTVLLTAVVAISTSQSPAAQEVPRVVTIANVSGTSPWRGLGCITPNYWVQNKPIVREPTIAVNPLDPRQQTAAWIDFDAGRIDAAFTLDGGITWHKASLPGLDPCTGKREKGVAYEQGADPILAYGADGTLYLSSLMTSNWFTPPAEAYSTPVLVQHATNGSDFSQPVEMPTKRTNDYPQMIADVSRAGHIYLTASALSPYPFIDIGERARGELMFSRSTDGGRTFETKTLITADPESPLPGAGAGEEMFLPYLEANYFWHSHLSQLADGTLVVTTRVPKGLGGEARSMRSYDRGETWQRTGDLPVLPGATTVERCGKRVIGKPSEVGLPLTGTQPAVLDGQTILYVAAENEGEDGPGHILLTSSADAGETWSTRRAFSTDLPVGLVRIATDKKGRIAIAYDEVGASEEAVCARPIPKVQVRTRFIVSDDKGKSWSQPITIGPDWWNIAGAGEGDIDRYVGEYAGIVAVPGFGFAVSDVQGRPLGPDQGTPEITGYQSVIVAQVAVGTDGD